MRFLLLDLLKKRLNPYSLVLKILSKLILWALASEKRRRRALSLLKPALRLYGKLLLRTTRGLYGVVLVLLAYLVSYLLKSSIGRAGGVKHKKQPS
ncbi:MAG: hypothetical protein WHS43_07965 [Aquificaceae bacterium]|uniref:hypothetical protein n=1 Tax=Hydrogenobacter sp. Uz 6-8 TaxID=3384828 RepID=UPI0030962244